MRRRVQLAACAAVIGGLAFPAMSSGARGGMPRLPDNNVFEMNDATRLAPRVQSRGDRFHAVGSLASGEIASDARTGFSFETVRGRRISVRPWGISLAAASAKFTNGGSVFYADTDQAADTVIRPTIDGIETFTLIRDASAPEAFSWEVALGPGESLQPDSDGGVNIVNAGVAIARVAPPWTEAADGAPVATWFTVAGPVLTMHVAHRGAGHRYPLVADPHWGWVHVVELMSARKTRSIIDLLRSSRDAAAIVGVIFGVVSDGASMVIANGLAAVGFGRAAEELTDALDRSNGRGVRIDAGLRCRHVPYAPDPCWPAIWINPR